MHLKYILPFALGCTLGIAALAPTHAGASIVKLRWTAPGDDGTVGQAAYYELRFSLFPIYESNFLQAIPVVSGVPRPSPAGRADSAEAIVNPGLTYYFALRSRDARGNWSAMSNIVIAQPGIALGVEGEERIFSQPSPNPASQSTRFSIFVPVAGPTEVQVFDLLGRRLRRLAGGWRPAGPLTLYWDLTDESGRHVSPGLYIVNGRVGNRTYTRRVAVVR